MLLANHHNIAFAIDDAYYFSIVDGLVRALLDTDINFAAGRHSKPQPNAFSLLSFMAN